MRAWYLPFCKYPNPNPKPSTPLLNPNQTDVGQQWVVWPNVPPTTPSSIPYPASKDLVGYQYLNGANAVTPGIGADTWCGSP